jgi:hypothetical protein
MSSLNHSLTNLSLSLSLSAFVSNRNFTFDFDAEGNVAARNARETCALLGAIAAIVASFL